MVAANIANMPLGGAQHRTANLQTETHTRAEAAQMLNVSERSVNTAKKVQTTGTPELTEAVTQGRVSSGAFRANMGGAFRVIRDI